MNAVDIEAAILGSLLIEPSRFADCEISTADFISEQHAQIFSEIQSMILTRDPVDVITVSERMEKATGSQWLAIVGGLVRQSWQGRDLGYYSRLARSYAVQRKALEVAEWLTENYSQENAVDETIQKLMALSRTSAKHEHTLIDAMGSALNDIDAALQSGGLVGVDTGLVDLNNCLGGFHKSDLIVIGARPSVGKTAFALNIADRCGRPCGLISGEQASNQIGLRMMAISGWVSAHNMRRAKLDESEWAKMTNALAKAKTKRMWIYDKPGPDISDVARQARKWKHQNDISILFVDYLQRIRGPKGMKKDNGRIEEVAEVARSLKDIARELDIPVVALAQVNRDVEKRADKRPTMSDLANSGEIEREADQIITLFRDEVHNPETQHGGICEASVVKNRHGPTGVIKLAWSKDFMRFDGLERDSSP